MPEPTLIPLDCLVAETVTWPRLELDRERVALFLDLYTDGGPAALPPLEVVSIGNGEYLLTDGWHRLEALSELHVRLAPVLVADVGGVDPRVFAYQRGLETCVTASRSLNRIERRAATERLVRSRPELTDVAIAKLTGVSNATVGRARRRIELDEQTQTDASTGERYQKRHDHHEVSRRLVRQLDLLWHSRPLLIATGLQDHARLGDTLGRELIDAHGPEEALVWAERFQTWADRAATVTRQATATTPVTAG